MIQASYVRSQALQIISACFHKPFGPWSCSAHHPRPHDKCHLRERAWDPFGGSAGHALKSAHTSSPDSECTWCLRTCAVWAMCSISITPHSDPVNVEMWDLSASSSGGMLTHKAWCFRAGRNLAGWDTPFTVFCVHFCDEIWDWREESEAHAGAKEQLLDMQQTCSRDSQEH